MEAVLAAEFPDLWQPSTPSSPWEAQAHLSSPWEFQEEMLEEPTILLLPTSQDPNSNHGVKEEASSPSPALEEEEREVARKASRPHQATPCTFTLATQAVTDTTSFALASMDATPSTLETTNLATFTTLQPSEPPHTQDRRSLGEVLGMEGVAGEEGAVILQHLYMAKVALGCSWGAGACVKGDRCPFVVQHLGLREEGLPRRVQRVVVMKGVKVARAPSAARALQLWDLPPDGRAATSPLLPIYSTSPHHYMQSSPLPSPYSPFSPYTLPTSGMDTSTSMSPSSPRPMSAPLLPTSLPTTSPTPYMAAASPPMVTQSYRPPPNATVVRVPQDWGSPHLLTCTECDATFASRKLVSKHMRNMVGLGTR